MSVLSAINRSPVGRAGVELPGILTLLDTSRFTHDFLDDFLLKLSRHHRPSSIRYLRLLTTLALSDVTDKRATKSLHAFLSLLRSHDPSPIEPSHLRDFRNIYRHASLRALSPTKSSPSASSPSPSSRSDKAKLTTIHSYVLHLSSVMPSPFSLF